MSDNCMGKGTEAGVAHGVECLCYYAGGAETLLVRLI